MLVRRRRDPPSADDWDSPQDDQCVSEPTGRSRVSASSPPRAACSARRSQDCASVSQKGLSLSSTAARAIRKQSSALLRSMFLGLMFTRTRYARLTTTQPANLGKLVTPERNWTEKPLLTSDWRHTRGRRLHSIQKEAARSERGRYCHA